MSSIAQHTLQKQYKDILKNPIPGFRITLKEDNIFEWEYFCLDSSIYDKSGNHRTSKHNLPRRLLCRTLLSRAYHIKATIKFPQDYPYQPPSFTFNRDFFHPNVYTDGKLCISILHPPGDDPMSGEKAEERWNPTQSVESILLSIVSLLNDPNVNSPANVDAGVLYRNDREAYNSIVKSQVQESKQYIPDDVVIPQSEDDFVVKTKVEEPVDDEFWYDDDDEEEMSDDDDEDYEE